jgi:glycosyltransferase involved in cell wall biosynthesis
METIFVVERSQELFDKIGDFIKNNDIRKIKVIFNNGERGASIARNIGVKNASGDIIAFVDDDVILFSDWAYEMVKTYDDDTIIGVAGPAIPLWEDESDAWFPEELYWIISCTAFTTWDKLRDTRNAWTTNASYHREVFDSGEFFSTNIGPKDKNGHREGWKWIAEDIELTSRVLRKIKKRVVYNPKVKVKHHVYKYRLKLKFMSRCAYWIGLTRPIVKDLYTDSEFAGNSLELEQGVLKRIITRLFPNIIGSIFIDPHSAWLKLKATCIVLCSAGIGYLSSVQPRIFGFTKKIFSP